LLEDLDPDNLTERVFRFASERNRVAALEEIGLDPESIQEIVDILQESSEATGLESILDDPFRPKPLRRYQKRYSDGSLGVFYSALESDTALAEVKYWYEKLLDEDSVQGKSYPRYYLRVTCLFSGRQIDLRPHKAEWPDLVHDSDYSFCNRLGTDAFELGLDGLTVPSARKEDGSCLPVFQRRALSDPQSEGMLVIKRQTDSGETVVQEVQ
jgi:hypothetical protein